MSVRVLISLYFTTFSIALFSQKDEVLFSVNNTPVHVSEFQYIYSKTNGPKADFSKASLEEYLDLYTNFKLKVQKAKDMRLDTISSLKQELDGYRKQLADSYLIDREVTEKLVLEAYEHTRQDVDISHVLIKMPENPSPADTLAAWNKTLEAKGKLEKGETFESVALAYSEDKSVKNNRGHIGYVTALFPSGFYTLEKAAYSAPLEKLTGPIRTSAGYHLMIVHNRRKARGEVEVAHILIRNDKSPDAILAKQKIDSIYAALQAGGNFEEFAKVHSHDKITAPKGGYLGFFGINRYDKSFEDAAFRIEKDGDFTAPVNTSIGWHIIKRISKKDDESYQQMKTRLQNKVKEDARFGLARKAMTERIKRDGKFTENRTTLDNFIATLEADTAKSFLTYKWKAPEGKNEETLFSFGGEMRATVFNFSEYAQKASRKRQQLANQGVAAAVKAIYDDFVEESALKYEERLLDAKYPEFKSLMREYEEGVLLFEVTKLEVWDKASQDTVGLQKFYNVNQAKYQWDQRAVVSQYSLVEKEKEKLNIIREYAKNNPADKVLANFNPAEGDKILTRTEKTFEKGRNEILEKLSWEVGALSAVDVNKRDKSFSFMKIEQLLPPGQKSLQEARGYVVADYQDSLEKQWLEQLKKEYKIKVNEKVFNSLIKKS